MAAEKGKRKTDVESGASASQIGNAGMDEKLAEKTNIRDTENLRKIREKYEETVQALKRIKEIWDTLDGNEKKMMRVIKKALIQKKRKLEEKLREEGC